MNYYSSDYAFPNLYNVQQLLRSTCFMPMQIDRGYMFSQPYAKEKRQKGRPRDFPRARTTILSSSCLCVVTIRTNFIR
jgi:hypothetical protein